jgi:hypothetical protein
MITVKLIHIQFSDFFWPEMPLPLRYAASVMDCTQKVKQNLKGTKYVYLLSVKVIYFVLKIYSQFIFIF